MRKKKLYSYLMQAIKKEKMYIEVLDKTREPQTTTTKRHPGIVQKATMTS